MQLFGAINHERKENWCYVETGKIFFKGQFQPLHEDVEFALNIYISFSQEKKIKITAYLSISGNLHFEKRTKYG